MSYRIMNSNNTGNGNYLLLSNALIRELNSIELAVFLTKLIYYEAYLINTKKIKDGDDFYYTEKSIANDLRLKKYKTRDFFVKLEVLGLLEIIKKGMPAKKMIKLNHESINVIFEKCKAYDFKKNEFDSEEEDGNIEMSENGLHESLLAKNRLPVSQKQTSCSPKDENSSIYLKKNINKIDIKEREKQVPSTFSKNELEVMKFKKLEESKFKEILKFKLLLINNLIEYPRFRSYEDFKFKIFRKNSSEWDNIISLISLFKGYCEESGLKAGEAVAEAVKFYVEKEKNSTGISGFSFGLFLTIIRDFFSGVDKRKKRSYNANEPSGKRESSDLHSDFSGMTAKERKVAEMMRDVNPESYKQMVLKYPNEQGRAIQLLQKSFQRKSQDLFKKLTAIPSETKKMVEDYDRLVELDKTDGGFAKEMIPYRKQFNAIHKGDYEYCFYELFKFERALKFLKIKKGRLILNQSDYNDLCGQVTAVDPGDVLEIEE